MLTLHKRHSKTCLTALKKNRKIDHDQIRFHKGCACAWCITGKHPTAARRFKNYSLHTSSWEAANAFKIKMETGNGDALSKDDMTIENAFDKWVEDKKRRGVSGQTLEGNHAALGKAIERYAKRKGITLLKQLDGEKVEEMVTAWSAPKKVGGYGEGWSADTACGHLSRLRAFFTYAIKREWVTVNYAKNVDPPRGDSEQVEPFTPEEEERIAKALDSDWSKGAGVKRSVWSRYPDTLRCLKHVLEDTGLRISDALRVRPEIVHVESDGSGTVTLQQWKLDGRFSRKDRDVTVYLEPGTVQEIRSVSRIGKKYVFMADFADESDKTGFKAHMKAEVMAAWYVFKKVIGKAAGVEDCRPHRFRHTFAIKKLINRWELSDVARLLGHKNSRITEAHYAKWTNRRQETLREKLARERDARKTVTTLARAS